MIRSAASLGLFLIIISSLIAGQVKSRVDLSGIPMSVSLAQPLNRVEVNQPVSINVVLKNAYGAAVAAVKNEKVEIRYQDQVIDGVIPAGQTSASFRITPRRSGIEKFEISAENLAGTSGYVLSSDLQNKVPMQKPSPPVPPTMTSPSPTHATPEPLPGRKKKASSAASGGKPEISTSTSPVFMTASGPSSQENVSLRLFVEPESVGPDGVSGSWTARIKFAVMGSENRLISATQDLQLHLLTEIGHVEPSDVMIKKDETDSFDHPAVLTSNRAGTDTLTVLSTQPEIQRQITYLAPSPTGLRLEATPAWVTNDGKSPVQIQVMLVAADKSLAKALADTEISLSSTRGTIPLTVKIAKGEYASSPVTLTSVQNGVATVTAQAFGLQEGQISASFLFPWVMMIMGSLGGLLGAFAHNPKAAVGSHWWRVLALGLIFGTVLSIAALLGVIGSLPKLPLPIEIAKIPSLNTAGALLIGFIGGYYGKKLWKGGDEGKEKAAGQPA